jgi:ribosome-binding factor A
LGRALGIRHSPELRFVPDELIESGARLSALINEAVKKDVATHVDDPPSAEASSDRDDQSDDDDHYDSDDDDSEQDDDDQASSRPRR